MKRRTTEMEGGCLTPCRTISPNCIAIQFIDCTIREGNLWASSCVVGFTIIVIATVAEHRQLNLSFATRFRFLHFIFASYFLPSCMPSRLPKLYYEFYQTGKWVIMVQWEDLVRQPPVSPPFSSTLTSPIFTWNIYPVCHWPYRTCWNTSWGK